MINLARIPSKLRLYTFCVLAWLVFNAGANAQYDSTLTRLKSFVQNINTFNTLLPQEKVYLHFDNTSYFLGEHIWFKAYVVNPTENRPTTMSRVLYVELLNQQGFVLQTKKLKIDDNGQCHGDFALTDSMFAGFYEVRAYTRYMFNFDQTNRWSLSIRIYRPGVFVESKEWFPFNKYIYPSNCYYSERIFSRVFPVYNIPTSIGDYDNRQMIARSWVPDIPLDVENHSSNTPKKRIQELSQQPLVNVSFFPEGGSLVKGVSSKVAFKAVDANNTELNLEGFILDTLGNEVASFKTQQRGMGAFFFCPTDTGCYKAQVIYENQRYTFPFPRCEEHGPVLRINNLTFNRDVLIEVDYGGEGAIAMEEMLAISIQCRGNVVWFDTLVLTEKKVHTVRVPKKVLPTGVNQITLFNAQGRIFAERLVFVNNEDEGEPIQVKPNWTKQTYKPFEAATLYLSLTDKTGKPVETNVSLAVRDANTTEGTYNTDNIRTNLLLSSELKGYLANPSYYFESNDMQHRSALELLMLTQGWRRYDWKVMAGVDTFTVVEPPEKGILLDGHISKFKEIDTNFFRFENCRSKSDQFETSIRYNAYVTLHVGITDTTTLIGEQTTTNGLYRFNLPEFQGTRYARLEVTDDNILKYKTQKNNLFTNLIQRFKDPIYDYKLIPYINRFSPIPKNTFTFYETNPPLTNRISINENMSRGSISKGVNLNAIVIDAKRKKQKGYPDFSCPDILISGDEALDMVMNLATTQNKISFHDLLDAYLGGILHLSVLNSDLYIYSDKIDYLHRLIRGTNPRTGGASKNDLDYIRNLLAENIESIAVYLCNEPRVPFKYNFPSAYVYIKTKDSSTRINQPNTRRTQIQGFSYLSDFYHPDYSKGVPPETSDFRRTLYWNPDVQTDSTGKATVTFYNNATCKQLEISAEGITKEGVPFVYKKEP